MTRKRFVKLLMSKGFSRNEAQNKAIYFNSRHVPYKKALALCYLSGAMVKVSDAALSAAKSIVKFTAAFRHYD